MWAACAYSGFLVLGPIETNVRKCVFPKYATDKIIVSYGFCMLLDEVTMNDNNHYDDRHRPVLGKGNIFGKNAFYDISFHRPQDQESTLCNMNFQNLILVKLSHADHLLIMYR